MGFLNPTFESKADFYVDRAGLDHTNVAERLGIGRTTWWRHRQNPRQMLFGEFQDFCTICHLSDSERLEASKLCR